MNRSLCHQLDDYLLGWLLADEAAAFERHLSDCPVCRRECALQQTIDGLLAGADEQLDAIPSGLIDRTRYSFRVARHRKAIRWALSLSVIAAALLFAVVGRFMFWSQQAANQDVAVWENSTPAPSHTTATSPFSESESPAISSRVVLADPTAGVVLECKTRDPKINIVWIYPTVKTVAKMDE